MTETMTLPVDLSRYVCGGYYLTKRVPRPEDISNLVPDSILTLSTCFTDIAPDDWADSGYKYDEEERIEEARKFGIPASAVPALVEMFTNEVAQHHITNAFPNLALAQRFYHHCVDTASIVLVGIGLERSLLTSLNAQRNDDVNHGYGLVERIEEGRVLESGGDVLGYEPLGYEATKFHSWLCHNIPEEAWTRLAIRPNSNGFIETFADAVRITADMKATGAEPAIWEPWLVVRYGEPIR